MDARPDELCRTFSNADPQVCSITHISLIAHIADPQVCSIALISLRDCHIAFSNVGSQSQDHFCLQEFTLTFPQGRGEVGVGDLTGTFIPSTPLVVV